MNHLHEQLAADAYWNGPAGLEVAKASFASEIKNALASSALLGGIDANFKQIMKKGAVATPLRSGEPIGIDDPDAILKVVEDMRTVPKKDIRGRRTDSPSTFDKKAKQIMDTPLLTGDMTGAKLQTAQGETIYVGRRAVYLQNSYSTELIGKESNMLGKGGNKREPVFMHRHPVDSVRTYKTRNEAVKCRIVSASIIAPAGFKRARAKHRSIIDLGFAGRLRPATGSAF